MALTLTPDLTDEILQLPLFAGVGHAAMTAWLKQRSRRGFNHGQALFRQGDDAGPMYIVVEGQVLVARETSAGENIKLAELGPGQVIGELSVLSPSGRSASAIGIGRGGVIEVTRGDMELGLALADPVPVALLRNLSLQLCERIRATDDKLARLHEVLHGTPAEKLEQNLRGELTGFGDGGGGLGRSLGRWLRKRR